jgi:hypothetical protein
MSAQTCSICGRDPRGHLAPSDEGAIVCKGCVAELADRLEGRILLGMRCVCGEDGVGSPFPGGGAQCVSCFLAQCAREYPLLRGVFR